MLAIDRVLPIVGGVDDTEGAFAIANIGQVDTECLHTDPPGAQLVFTATRSAASYDVHAPTRKHELGMTALCLVLELINAIDDALIRSDSTFWRLRHVVWNIDSRVY